MTNTGNMGNTTRDNKLSISTGTNSNCEKIVLTKPTKILVELYYLKTLHSDRKYYVEDNAAIALMSRAL